MITPERTNRESKKRPDYTLQRLNENNDGLELHLAFEIQKVQGDYLDRALSHLVTAMGQTGEIAGECEMFFIVQRGLPFGFFEYYSYDEASLEHHEVDHLKGCVPILFLNENLPLKKGRIKDLRKDIPKGV